MSKRRNSRVEQEINEILERKDLSSPGAAPPGRGYQSTRQKLRVFDAQSILNRIPPGILWLIGVFGFALLAILVSDWSRNLAIFFGILSVVVVFSPIVLWSRSAPVAPQQKEWRGRVIHLPPRQDGPIGKLKYKIWEMRNRSR